MSFEQEIVDPEQDSTIIICANCKLRYKQFFRGTILQWSSDLRVISLVISCPYCDNIVKVNS